MNRRGLAFTVSLFVGTLLLVQSAFAQQIPLPRPRPAEFGPSNITPPEPLEIPQKPAAVEPPPASAPVKATPVKTLPKAIISPDASRETLIAEINRTLAGMKHFSALFVQNGYDGQRATGSLAVLRPGRLRFDYDPPNAIEVIADGNVVAIRDTRLGTQDVYSIGLTPLKFLLRDTINIENDAKIADVKVSGERVIVDLEDSSTFGGTSRISLGFDRRTMQLKQWTITDPQGYDVSILLTEINLDDAPEPLLFVVPEKPGTAKTR
jgi:outer membrane lipoprotein-sorting protein